MVVANSLRIAEDEFMRYLLDQTTEQLENWFAEHGIDLEKGDLIEVAACAQHFQGGVKIDEQACTTIPSVWAAGEYSPV